MERILQYSREYILGWSSPLRKKLTGNTFFRLFPFMVCSEPLEHSKHDFDNRENYLFLHSIYSTKEFILAETKSFTFSLLAFFIITVYGISFLTNTPMIIVVFAIIAFSYLGFILFKILVVYEGFSFPPIDFSTEIIDAITDDELPTYTILIPLRDEAEVMEQIIAAMTAIDYPPEKLDVIITVEQYDTATIKAIKKVKPPKHFRTLILPDVMPKTKPKATNVAFLEAQGKFLVIYDAEIIPDPDQLKKAYLAFKKHPEISCFQTRLEHYNTDQNILTRLFNIEFSFHYDLFLPGLQKLNFPIPLSGHSTHFRLNHLKKIGAWDPYNVAEDCDVGIRLYRYGYRTGIINSVSREEAASTLKGWIMQRTRWMKGFIQTSVVNLRYPLHLKRDLGGWKNFFAFLILVPASVLVNVLNLFSWTILSVWFLTGTPFIKELYPFLTLYIANVSFICGGFLFVYLNLVAVYRRGKFHLVKYALLIPFYWFLLAAAALRAIVQSITNPHTWEKTKHGTHLKNPNTIIS